MNAHQRRIAARKKAAHWRELKKNLRPYQIAAMEAIRKLPRMMVMEVPSHPPPRIMDGMSNGIEPLRIQDLKWQPGTFEDAQSRLNREPVNVEVFMIGGTRDVSDAEVQMKVLKKRPQTSEAFEVNLDFSSLKLTDEKDQ